MPIIIKKTCAMFTIVLLGCLSSIDSCASEVTKEDKVKAAIIYKLTKFITWPEKKQTLTLCIIGSGAINSELLKINHKFSMGRKFSVTRQNPKAPLDKLCDLVYIHNTKVSDTQEVLNILGNKSVLTISDSDQFVYQGGVIGLFRTGSRIQFAISKSAAKNAHISISSQLMGLAKVVK